MTSDNKAHYTITFCICDENKARQAKNALSRLESMFPNLTRGDLLIHIMNHATYSMQPYSKTMSLSQLAKRLSLTEAVLLNTDMTKVLDGWSAEYDPNKYKWIPLDSKRHMWYHVEVNQ